MDLVRFYACQADPLRVALKLALKAGEQAQPTVVCGARAELDALSAALWNCEGFVAHAGPSASERVREHSRLQLCEQPPAQGVSLLINLGLDLPDDLAAQRLFELVGPTDEARAAGRRRYRRHQQLGRPLETVTVGA